VNATDKYRAMVEVIALGSACLREGRREQWQPAIDELHAQARNWYRGALMRQQLNEARERNIKGVVVIDEVSTVFAE
jgi:hypothetical protein